MLKYPDSHLPQCDDDVPTVDEHKQYDSGVSWLWGPSVIPDTKSPFGDDNIVMEPRDHPKGLTRG